MNHSTSNPERQVSQTTGTRSRTRRIDAMLGEYANAHRNRTNQIIHKFCVPLIMFSTLGLAWAIPFPNQADAGLLNWASVLAGICMVFYFALANITLSLGMLVSASLMLLGLQALDQMGLVLPISAGIFAFAWVMQLIGHKIEGSKPSFFKDLLFLLIGPLWVLKWLYRQMGLSENP